MRNCHFILSIGTDIFYNGWQWIISEFNWLMHNVSKYIGPNPNLHILVIEIDHYTLYIYFWVNDDNFVFCSEMWSKCVFVQIWKALVTKSILLKRIELHRTKVWSCSTFHITCSPLLQFYNHFSIQIIGNLKCSGKRISQDRLIYTFQQSKQGGYWI